MKRVVATTAKTAASIAYNLERLFKPPVLQLQQEGAEALQRGKGMTVMIMR